MEEIIEIEALLVVGHGGGCFVFRVFGVFGVFRVFGLTSERELEEDALGVGQSDVVWLLGLVIGQEGAELVRGHELPAVGELGEDFLHVGGWAHLAGLELAVEALEHLVVVARSSRVAHFRLN